ncbi:MAG: hypothetical protein WD872_06980 [Pirellulaceae bacterium]
MTTPSSLAPPSTLDPDSQAARRERRARWWFVVSVLVFAPIVLLVAGVAAVVIWFQVARSAAFAEVQKEVARIQAAGEPITTEDLYAYHRPAAGTKDITPLWLAALQSFDEAQFGKDAGTLPIVGSGQQTTLAADDPSGQLAQAEQFLAKYDATVAATLAAARESGECRFPVQFEQGVAMLLPKVQKMRGVARLLSLRTQVAMARGDAPAAIESVEATFAASRAMENQLTLVEHLVSLAIAGVAIQNVESLLNEMDLTDEQLVQLQAAVERADLRGGLTTGMLGERGMGYHAFHHMEQMTSRNNAGAMAPPGEGHLSRPVDCKFYLETVRQLVEASREPMPQALRQAQQAELNVKAVIGVGNPLTKMNYMLTAMMMPAGTAAFAANARGQAQFQLLRCAIATRRYQQKHATDPPALAQLVPEFLPSVPLDPFDGQPLRMKTSPAEIVLYSIGKDGKDDGGNDPKDSGEPDLVVRLQAKP